MVKDLEETTLTQDQRRELDRIEVSFKNGDYAIVLRDILLMNANINNNAHGSK